MSMETTEPSARDWTVRRDGASVCGIIECDGKILFTGLHFNVCVEIADAHNATLQPPSAEWTVKYLAENFAKGGYADLVAIANAHNATLHKPSTGELYVCNKCGYAGKEQKHDACNYLAAPAPSAGDQKSK